MASRKCPVCAASVNTQNLPRHLQSVHPREATSEMVRGAKQTETEAPRAPRQRTRSLRTRPSWRVPAAILVILLVVGGVWFVSTQSTSPYNANTPVTEMCMQQHSGFARHDHALLTITIMGANYQIPGDIGITPECMRPIHTHDTTGQIHVESPVPHEFTLRDFFLVWGQPFSSSQILSSSTGGGRTITMTVNSVPNSSYENFVFPHETDATKTNIVITYQ